MRRVRAGTGWCGWLYLAANDPLHLLVGGGGGGQVRVGVADALGARQEEAAGPGGGAGQGGILDGHLIGGSAHWRTEKVKNWAICIYCSFF